MSAPRRRWLAIAAMIAAAAGCAERAQKDTPEAGTGTGTGTGEESNVVREDYVGPETCGSCHERNFGRWRQSLHAVMNQLAAPGAVMGDFGDAVVAYGGGQARFERDGDAFVMALRDPQGATRRYRVTRTIGSASLQEYVGVRLDERGAATGDELRLPFGWWKRRAAWYPQPYFDSWYGAEWRGDSPAFDAFVPDPSPWATRCAWCHNTYPFELRALRPSLGMGPEQYVTAVAPVTPPAVAAAVVSDNRLPIDQLVTVGISCESCHLGGRAHADDPDRGPPSFVPVGPHVQRRAGAPDLRGGRKNPRVVNAVCGQCHSTPSPRFADGAPARNSSEALALAAGTCNPAIRCVDCHDPHQRGPGAGAPDQPRHVAACTGCHRALADPAAARAHARHDPAAVSCLDCHMPRLVQGVSRFVRSHRISSPSDPRMLASGAPNACNLCHLDRSIRWTVAALRTGWSADVQVADGWAAAYGGDLDFAVGPAWLESPATGARLAAAAAYARRGDRRDLPLLVAGLDDPVAYTRMWLLFAIEDLAGAPLPVDAYDPRAAPAVRAAQAATLETWAAAQAAQVRAAKRVPAGK